MVTRNADALDGLTDFATGGVTTFVARVVPQCVLEPVPAESTAYRHRTDEEVRFYALTEECRV
ncbi:hypothetical protein [Haloarcula sp. 1CSR25-25]|uniref:hypothetical protein n=1 Tax=Haloarcula sp. 1CSR25-25 TaxID=2862545 RepID=UPI002895688E|nr:hypothetical protein [Haloarcula sp. 1CSR25-25]MDT3436991.1 hypothetical protein [Haloarcula sp. 1CSR25-25]